MIAVAARWSSAIAACASLLQRRAHSSRGHGDRAGTTHAHCGAANGWDVRIVAVPGLGLSVDVVRRALDQLPGTTWAAVLLPAFGRRARRGTALAPERLAGQLLDELGRGDGADPVVLVGHSASCQVVAEVAIRAPTRVAALVLVGPSTDPRAATWPGLVKRWLRTAVHEKPTQVPLLVRDYARTGLISMARGMDAARHHRLDHALAAVRCPVLVVRGRNDALCPAEWAGILASSTSDGRAESLPRGAHMVPITHARALAARIAAFLPTASASASPMSRT